VYRPWCYFCGFPSKLHTKETGSGKACRANGFCTGIAWAVFADQGVQNDIGEKLECPPEVWADGNSWFKWLVQKDDSAAMYNLHRVTRWFFSEMVDRTNANTAAAHQ
jgi:hypothetical protein